MAQALENTRPAYVKLAFPGTDLGTYDVSKKLKSFEHVILDGSKGSVFEFELISPGDEIEELFKNQAALFYDEIAVSGTLRNNTYVLMEYGYVGEGDELIKSKVHSGHIISLKYLFMDNEERSIRFTVADVLNYHSAYTMGTVAVTEPLKGPNGSCRKPSDVIISLLESLISKTPFARGLINLSEKSRQVIDSSQPGPNPLFVMPNLSLPQLQLARGISYEEVEGLLQRLGISTGTINELDYSPAKQGAILGGSPGEVQPDNPSKQQTGALDAEPSTIMDQGLLSTPLSFNLTAEDVELGEGGVATGTYESFLNQQGDGAAIYGYIVNINGEFVKT